MEIQYLVPNYFDKFTCLGGACKHTCCKDWSIHISKSDYKNLMKQRVPADIKEKLNTFANRISEEEFERTKKYAKIHMREDGYCPFFTEDGLCGLQIRCGAKTLPNICQIFPRIANVVFGNVVELNLRMACEGTTQLLVDTTDSIQFDIRQHSEKIENGAYCLHPEMVDLNPLMLHYWEIKALGIGILQNRFYTLPQRMLYLGFVLNRLIEYEATDRLSEVGTLLQGLMEQEDSEALRQSLKNLPEDAASSMATQALLAKAYMTEGFEVLYRQAIKKISACDETNADEKNADVTSDSEVVYANLYRQAREQYNAFCEKYPHVMENVAIHIFQETAMPFGGVYFGTPKEQKLNIWENYVFYCWRMSIMQFILGALVTPDTPLNEVALMISIIARQFPNSSEGAEIRMENMREMGMTTIEQLSILLKG